MHTVDMANTASSIRATAKNSPSRNGRFIVAPAPIRNRLKNVATNPDQPTHSTKPRQPFLKGENQSVFHAQVIIMSANTLSMKCESGNDYTFPNIE